MLKIYFFVPVFTLFLFGGHMETTHIHWLGHASFRIEDSGRQIYIDPYNLLGGLPKADYILVTHSHDDHFSPRDIAKIQKTGTLIVAPADVAAAFGGKVIAVRPDCDTTVGALKITTIPAYNVGKKFHPRESNWVGYILTLSNGQRIYHAGDTDATPEMAQVKTDIALLPCGGTYTMTAPQAAEAANIFRPAVLIPMHWGTIVGSKDDAVIVQKKYQGKTVIKPQEH